MIIRLHPQVRQNLATFVIRDHSHQADWFNYKCQEDFIKMVYAHSSHHMCTIVRRSYPHCLCHWKMWKQSDSAVAQQSFILLSHVHPCHRCIQSCLHRYNTEDGECLVSAQITSFTFTACVQPLLVTTVSMHLLSKDSDAFQISAAIHRLPPCLSGASQGDYERYKVQREGKMPVTQAPQKHFCPPKDIGLMCSFCRFNSLDTPISSCYHVF